MLMHTGYSIVRCLRQQLGIRSIAFCIYEHPRLANDVSIISQVIKVSESKKTNVISDVDGSEEYIGELIACRTIQTQYAIMRIITYIHLGTANHVANSHISLYLSLSLINDSINYNHSLANTQHQFGCICLPIILSFHILPKENHRDE